MRGLGDRYFTVQQALRLLLALSYSPFVDLGGVEPPYLMSVPEPST